MKSSNIFSCERNVIDMNAKDLFSIETFFNEAMLNMSDCKFEEDKQIIRHAPLIALNKVSRNMSMYQDTAILNALQSPYVAELFKRGTCFCELEHPDINCTRERFMKVDPDNTCGRVMNYNREGDLLRGDFQFVQPKGYIPLDWFKKGINFGWSIRILTPNYEERKDMNGNPYVYKHGDMRFISFDVVRIGGFKEASIVTDVDSYDASKENWNGIHASWTNKRKKEEFKRLLEAQESLPIMEDIYGFSMKDVKNISYSEEGLITIVLDNDRNHSKAVKIPTNTYRVNQVLMSGV